MKMIFLSACFIIALVGGYFIGANKDKINTPEFQIEKNKSGGQN